MILHHMYVLVVTCYKKKDLKAAEWLQNGCSHYKTKHRLHMHRMQRFSSPDPLGFSYGPCAPLDRNSSSPATMDRQVIALNLPSTAHPWANLDLAFALALAQPARRHVNSIKSVVFANRQ